VKEWKRCYNDDDYVQVANKLLCRLHQDHIIYNVILLLLFLILLLFYYYYYYYIDILSCTWCIILGIHITYMYHYNRVHESRCPFILSNLDLEFCLHNNIGTIHRTCILHISIYHYVILLTSITVIILTSECLYRLG